MRKPFSITRSPVTNVLSLFWLRNITLAGQIIAFLAAKYGAGIDIPVLPLLVIFSLMIVVNIATRMRLNSLSKIPELEMFAHIMVDIAALSALLFFTGGSTNPFTVFYLLPVTFAAMTLSKRLTWAVAMISALCYSLLLFYHDPLTSVLENHETLMRMHIVGMWLTFLLSAGLVTYFLGGIRDRELLLAQARETTLHNERILAIGTMAAGAAHELSTPLTTIGVLAKELQEENADNTELVADLSILRRQVEACKNTITNLLASAGQDRLEQAVAYPVTDFLDTIIKKWKLLRPVVHFENNVVGNSPVPLIVADETFSQALINLLNNAADASPSDIEINTSWNPVHITIEVRDRGQGFQGESIENIGKQFFSTKGLEEGRGLGLFLAKASIERLGGSLQLRNRNKGGMVAQITLPIAQEEN